MRRVIIVDDDRQVGLCLEKLIPWKELDLELAGIAYSGEEGFQLALEKQPDVIISDLVMPGLDGAEFCRRIMDVMSDVAFIFLTAYEDFSVARLGMRYHVADYVLKPIDRSKIAYLTELLRAIRQESDEKDYFFRVTWDMESEADMLRAITEGDSAYFGALFRRIAADSAMLAREPALVRALCTRLIDLYFRAQGDTPAVRERRSEAMSSVREAKFTMDMLLTAIDLYSANSSRAEDSYYCELCHQVRRYIDRHYADPDLSLGSVAAAFSYSPDHLGRLFAKTTGDTVLTCITDKRVSEALRLFEDTLLNVRAVAEAVGYANAGHLTQLVKKRTGMTPQEYRSARAQ